MSMGYISPKDFEKKFKIGQSQNPQGAQVIENLSGRAQLLKSASNSVSFKNFNGGQIDENHLVQDAYNRTIQTDQTDQYTEGVTTDHLEVAPTINKQTTLTDSHSTTITNLNETFNTTDHRETLHGNQEVYIQNKQETIPTNLQQKINNFGGLAAQSVKRQIGTKNIKSQNYTMQFGKMTMNSGGTYIQGNGSINSQSIYIGGGSPDLQDRLVPASWTAHKRRMNIIPKIEHTFTSNTVKLPPVDNGQWAIQIEISVSGECELENEDSENPLVMGQAAPDMVKSMINGVVNDFFKNLQVQNGSITGTLSADGSAPSFTVTNEYGEYEVSGGVMAKPIYGGAIFKYTNGVSANKKPCDDWLVTLSGEMDTTVTIKKKNMIDEAEMAANNLLDKAIDYFLAQQPGVDLEIPTRNLTGYTPIVNNVYENLGNFINSFEEILVTYAPDPSSMAGTASPSENAIVTEAIAL